MVITVLASLAMVVDWIMANDNKLFVNGNIWENTDIDGTIQTNPKAGQLSPGPHPIYWIMVTASLRRLFMPTFHFTDVSFTTSLSVQAVTVASVK